MLYCLCFRFYFIKSTVFVALGYLHFRTINKSSWQKQSQKIIIFFKHFLKSEYLQIIFFPSHDLSSFPLCPFDSPSFFLIIFFVCLFSCCFYHFFSSILMVIISLELTIEGQPRPQTTLTAYLLWCGLRWPKLTRYATFLR